MKKYIYWFVIPFTILLIDDFGKVGFIIVGVYLLSYFFFSRSSSESTKTTKKKVKTKSSSNSEATEKVSPTVHKPKKIPSKFSLSQNEFEAVINEQLNSLKGSFTKIFWVGDEHRNHPWSKQPGGCTVVVLFKNKTCLGYDKVKRPSRYTMKITKDFISNHYSNKHTDSLEEYLNEIYLTSDSGVDLKKVWHSNMHQNPWEILRKHRTK